MTADEQTPEEAKATPQEAGGQPGAPCILVADDVALMRSLLLRTLTKEGYEVIDARNGKEALKKARQRKPDLILLDSMMPVMSGIECLEALKADPETAHIPVIMCTARTEKLDVIAAAKRGASDYIIKPFKIEILMEHVAQHLPADKRLPGA